MEKMSMFFFTAVSVSSFLIFHNWKMHKNGNIKNQKVWFCLLFKKHQKASKSIKNPIKNQSYSWDVLQEKTCVHCLLWASFTSTPKTAGGSFVNGSPPVRLSPHAPGAKRPFAVHINDIMKLGGFSTSELVIEETWLESNVA